MDVTKKAIYRSEHRNSGKNRRMKNVLLLIGFVLASSHFAEAQQPGKVPRVGYLSAFDAARESTRAEEVRLALRPWLQRRTEHRHRIRYAQGQQDLFPKLAAELVRLKVDIILVSGADILIRAAKNATNTIPIVMIGGGLDPVEAGLVDSLARPGGNVTGLTNLSRNSGGKRLELSKKRFQKFNRLAVLYDSGSGSEREVKENLPVAARAPGLTIRPWKVRDADDFENCTDNSKLPVVRHSQSM